MPIKFGPGEKIASPVDTYEVDAVLSQGAFAHASRAKSAKRGGGFVFLKRYFSPTRALDWYDEFVDHQQELKRRITSNDGLKQFCYGFIDFFEGTEGRSKKTFHQVFEFVEHGKPLTAYLAELETAGPSARWEQRVTFARVMIMAIAALHAERIVHTDLKPDNLLLVPNPHRPGNYHLKVIDLDWAIFSDRQAPWHGQGVGYVGTPGYMSPEHMRQEVPAEASDVYTCALMLGELLGGGHAFAGKRGDDDALKRATLGGKFQSFKLQLPVDKINNPAYLEGLVNRALSPEPTARPTAEELKAALFGRGVAGETREERPHPPAPSPAPTPIPAPKPNRAPSVEASGVVELMFEGRVVLRIGIDTVVGRSMVKPVSADAQFFGDAQYRIHRSPEKQWMVTALRDTPNETLLDGRRLVAADALRDGMRIAVGNSAKGIEKLPLIVRLS